VSSPNSPPPRSAHQAVAWKNSLFIFGMLTGLSIIVFLMDDLVSTPRYVHYQTFLNSLEGWTWS
jgi:hypothetical protein